VKVENEKGREARRVPGVSVLYQLKGTQTSSQGRWILQIDDGV
jgi:hypothetical protein